MVNEGVTVIIPVYNGGKTIKKVLDAITNQEYLNYKVMVIDDGSTDDTEEIVKTYSGVKYIRNDKNLGLANSLNKGIQLSKNELVITVHSDCVPPHKNWITHMVEIVTADEKIGAASSKYTLPIKIWKKLDFIPKILCSPWVDHPMGLLNNKCDIYKKSVLSKIGNFDSKSFRVHGEDINMIHTLLSSGYRIESNDDDLVAHIHCEDTSLWEYFIKAVRSGEGNGVMLRRWRYFDRRILKVFCFLGLFLPKINVLALLGLILISLRSAVLHYNKSKYYPTLLLIPFIDFVKSIFWSFGFLRGFIIGTQRF